MRRTDETSSLNFVSNIVNRLRQIKESIRENDKHRSFTSLILEFDTQHLFDMDRVFAIDSSKEKSLDTNNSI